MAKKKSTGLLDRLAGKRIVFHGKFAYGVEASLKAMAEAQQGRVTDDLDAKSDYLVLADLNAGKTIQKKALGLNAKGATIQVVDADAFKQLAAPSDEEILELIRANRSETFNAIYQSSRIYYSAAKTIAVRFHAESLKGLRLKSMEMEEIEFDGCDFSGTELSNTYLYSAPRCDFSKITGENARFGDLVGSKLTKAQLKTPSFEGDYSEVDFSSTELETATFSNYHHWTNRASSRTACVFRRAKLQSAGFHSQQLKAFDFGEADLSGAAFVDCSIESADFSKAKLCDVVFAGCKLIRCKFGKADLTRAGLANAELTECDFAGADLKDANLRGTTLKETDLSQAKNYDPERAAGGTVGPALTELDQTAQTAKRIQITFRITLPDDDRENSAANAAGGVSIAVDDTVSIDTNGLKYGWGVRIPSRFASGRRTRYSGSQTMSDALIETANLLNKVPLRFETLEVSSTKSPLGGKALRDLALKAIAEAFAQALPTEEELAAATKLHRDAEREKGAAERERREQAKAQVAKQKEKATKQIAKKVAKAVGKVSDVASFLKALELRIEKPKIDKATSMLKAAGFKLFNDVTDEHVSGVVKSQSDPDLVYACRLAHDGKYSCCTQNLNVCGGLRGSICKHLLVLIIGLVQAGELDPSTIDDWIAKTHGTKPELDRDGMGDVFIKYKGAEAGEIDWRPTETVPEDYYAL